MKTNTKNSKDTKKSQGTMIAVILIILLCLIVIVLLWRVIFPMMQNTEEEAGGRQDLTKTTIGINDVSGDLSNPAGKIDVTLTRGSEPIELINKTITKRTVTTTISYTANVSIISTIDISGSMGTSFCSIPTCTTSSTCLNVCHGSWKTKLNFAKEANIDFIENVFDKNPDNEMGIVAFSTTVLPSGVQTLTKDEDLLKQKINSFNPASTTNICEGLKKSIELLTSSSNNIKVIVLMSDGEANVACGPGGAKQSAINQAIIANESNITIYTIGFGKDADNETLERIANSTTNGTYSYADISGLSVVYNNIFNSINTLVEEEESAFYEALQKIDILRFVISNDTSSYVYDMPKDIQLLLPLETKTYTIDTGPMTNINKIDVYLIVHTEDGKEISELVSSWTPGTEN